MNKILIIKVIDFMEFMKDWKKDDPEGFKEIALDEYVNTFILEDGDLLLIDAKPYNNEGDLLLTVKEKKRA